MDNVDARGSVQQPWRQAEISPLALASLFVVLAFVALGGASVGGWGGVVITVLALVSVIALVYVWSAAGHRPTVSSDVEADAGGAQE